MFTKLICKHIIFHRWMDAGGQRFEAQLRRYADGIGWAMVVLVVVGLLLFYV